MQLPVARNEVEAQEFISILWHWAQNNRLFESNVIYLHVLKNTQIILLPGKVLLVTISHSNITIAEKDCRRRFSFFTY